jgi:hypothetical protein
MKRYSGIIVLLFLPYFLLANALFDSRKKKAIKIAQNRSKTEHRKVFVIQHGRRFCTGTREELRRMDKRCYKALRKAYGKGVFDYDYRNSIVHTAQIKQDFEDKNT